MSAQHTPESLIPAIRQYKHNDGTNGFVIAFDEKLTIEAFAKLEQQRDELQAWKDKALEVYPNTARLIAIRAKAKAQGVV